MVIQPKDDCTLYNTFGDNRKHLVRHKIRHFVAYSFDRVSLFVSHIKSDTVVCYQVLEPKCVAGTEHVNVEQEIKTD